MSKRPCRFVKDDGEPCQAAAMPDGDLCFFHDPEHAKEAADARRLGGLHRKREKITSAVYDFEGLHTSDGILRLLEIAATDTLAMDNSIARNRTLTSIANVATRVVQGLEAEDRLQAIEEILGPRLKKAGGKT